MMLLSCPRPLRLSHLLMVQLQMPLRLILFGSDLEGRYPCAAQWDISTVSQLKQLARLTI